MGLHVRIKASPEVQVCDAGEVGKIQEEFKKRGVKIVALSLNDVSAHKE